MPPLITGAVVVVVVAGIVVVVAGTVVVVVPRAWPPTANVWLMSLSIELNIDVGAYLFSGSPLTIKNFVKSHLIALVGNPLSVFCRYMNKV